MIKICSSILKLTFYIFCFGIILLGCKKKQTTTKILNPNITYGSLTDQDGNQYATVNLGSIEIMAENLRTTKYSNGDPIPNVQDGTQWINLTSGAWSHYNNDSQYENPYGKLYNWYAVTDSRNVCPSGWHVPTDSEWTIITDYLGGNNLAGGKLKSIGTQYWDSPNTDATNESGFSGLPGGLRRYDGYFSKVGEDGHWWSLHSDSAYGGVIELVSYSGGIGGYYSEPPVVGYSVRCIKD